MHNINKVLSVVILSLALGLFVTGRAEPVPALLAENGEPCFPVVIATDATVRVQVAATNLAERLTRITGASFIVQAGEGTAGVAVGMPTDFPKLPIAPDFQPDLPTGREDYLLQTHAGGIYLLGSTELAVEHAVWDFLFRLGYRQFFPGENWEIVPSQRKLEVVLNTLQRPAFNGRIMSSATSRGADGFSDQVAYQEWLQRNRIADGWRGIGGHIYGFIIRARQ